jgi:hypothetical protein
LSIVADGTLSSVEPSGRPRMARRWFPYCEVSHASIV